MRYHSMTSGNRWKRSYRSWLWLGLLVFLAPLPAKADPTCGSTVTSNVTLTTDITCMDMTWITIGADYITVDLNGRIVTCMGPGYQGSCQEFSPSRFGINTNGHRNIRVINSNEEESGVIKGFDVGVWVNGGSNVKVKGITITGPHKLPANPRPPSQGMLVTGVACGLFNDASNDANLLVKISTNTVSNHLDGIALNQASCVQAQNNTVFNNNSDVSENHGILLQDSSHNKVVNNNVFGNGENFLTDGGIIVKGALSMGNLITQNEVSDNNGDGIALRDGATANVVMENEMLFNGDPDSGVVFFDAAARSGFIPGSSGGVNTWKDNECITSTSTVPLATEPPAGACKEDETTIRHTIHNR